MQKITPHLWFDDDAEQAVNLYTSLFENSAIEQVTHYDETVAEVAGRPVGSVLTVIGIGLFLYSEMKKHGVGDAKRLMRTGIYSKIRHPMYKGYSTTSPG